MIKKVIIIFLSLFVGYNGLAFIKKWPSKAVTQWEDNNRLIDKYLFECDHLKVNTVVVGSSMAFRMTASQNPCFDSVYNLSLGGQGLFDGLEVLKRSEQKPKYLFIESNVLYRLPRNGYAASFFVPGVYQLKKVFPGMRENFKPITLIQYLYYGVGGIFVTHINMPDIKDKEHASKKVKHDSTTNSVKAKISDRTLEVFDKLLKESNWSTIVEKLKGYTDYFSRHGTKLIFFEMPTESVALESNLNAFIRNTFQRDFQSDLFVKARAMSTTDGVHLTLTDANAFLSELLMRGRK